MTTDCIFCKIISKQIPANFVYEDEQVVVIKDINPQAPHHLLILPKEHIPTINDLQEQHKPLVGHMMLVVKKLAKDLKIDKSGYRVLMNCQEGAGQTVFHVHMHLLGGRTFNWPPG